jgi:beta-lactamase superfamily II metal-dependent hydrolase
MTTIKSFSVGHGDLFYVRHNSDNFTIIDCSLTGDRDVEIIAELKAAASGKGLKRFISTHPDQDHFGGIEKLDAGLPILNFYVVKNKATKTDKTVSFEYYCKLRDDTK